MPGMACRSGISATGSTPSPGWASPSPGGKGERLEVAAEGADRAQRRPGRGRPDQVPVLVLQGAAGDAGQDDDQISARHRAVDLQQDGDEGQDGRVCRAEAGELGDPGLRPVGVPVPGLLRGRVGRALAVAGQGRGDAEIAATAVAVTVVVLAADRASAAIGSKASRTARERSRRADPGSGPGPRGRRTRRTAQDRRSRARASNARRPAAGAGVVIGRLIGQVVSHEIVEQVGAPVVEQHPLLGRAVRRRTGRPGARGTAGDTQRRRRGSGRRPAVCR